MSEETDGFLNKEPEVTISIGKPGDLDIEPDYDVVIYDIKNPSKSAVRKGTNN